MDFNCLVQLLMEDYNKLVHEKFIKELVSSDKYKLSDIENWSKKLIITMIKTARYEDFYSFYDNPQSKQIFRKMVPTVLSAITDLYELDYKKHLLQTTYHSYSNELPSIDQINNELKKIAVFLRQFIITSATIRRLDEVHEWNLDYKDDITKFDYIRNASMKHFEEELKKKFNRYRHYGYSDPEEPSGTYYWDIGPMFKIFKLLYSNNYNEIITGVTMMFNVFHDDYRGIVVATPTKPGEEPYEEYMDFILKREEY